MVERKKIYTVKAIFGDNKNHLLTENGKLLDVANAWYCSRSTRYRYYLITPADYNRYYVLDIYQDNNEMPHNDYLSMYKNAK